MTPESTDGDDEQPTCGHPTDTTGDPCQRQVSTGEDRCYLHAEDGGVPDDHGAPDGNHNRTESGIHMSVRRRTEWFRETGDYDLFTDYLAEYGDKAENRIEAASLASAAVIRDKLEGDLLSDGLFRRTQVGDPDDVEDPDDAFRDTPKTSTIDAYTDAMREVRLGLAYEGVTTGSGGDPAGGHGDVSAMWGEDDE